MVEQIYSDYIREYCKNNSIVFVKESENMIESFFKLDQDMPNEYRWRFSGLDSIAKQANSADTPQDLNKIYWIDQTRNIEAYAIMS